MFEKFLLGMLGIFVLCLGIFFLQLGTSNLYESDMTLKEQFKVESCESLESTLTIDSLTESCDQVKEDNKQVVNENTEIKNTQDGEEVSIGYSGNENASEISSGEIASTSNGSSSNSSNNSTNSSTGGSGEGSNGSGSSDGSNGSGSSDGNSQSSGDVDSFVIGSDEIIIVSNSYKEVPLGTEISSSWLEEEMNLRVIDGQEGDVTRDSNYTSIDMSDYNANELGTYEIIVTAENGVTSTSLSMSIEVVEDSNEFDVTAPVIYMDSNVLEISENVYDFLEGEELKDYLVKNHGLKVIDDYDGDITYTLNVRVDKESLSRFGGNEEAAIYVYATDEAGNTNYSVFPVELVSSSYEYKPEIYGKSEMYVKVDDEIDIHNPEEMGIEAYDENDGDITSEIKVENAEFVSTTTPGEYTILYSITNSQGVKNYYEYDLHVAGTITTCEELQEIEDNLEAMYVLENDIDCDGYDFEPIGSEYNSFSGKLDGQGYEIQNLTIDSSESSVGLFASNSGEIKNLGMTNVSITGPSNVGGIAGSNSGTIVNSYVKGEINGTSYYSSIGGIAGSNSGTIRNSYTDVDLTGYYVAGGIAGSSVYGVIDNCKATVSMISAGDAGLENYAGGIVGNSYRSEFTNNYAKIEDLKGFSYAGGAIGNSESDVVSGFYVEGQINADEESGIVFGQEDNSVTNNINYDQNISLSGKLEFYEGQPVEINSEEDFYEIMDSEVLKTSWKYVEGEIILTYGMINGIGSDIIMRGQISTDHEDLEELNESADSPYILGTSYIEKETEEIIDIDRPGTLGIEGYGVDGEDLTTEIELIDDDGYETYVGGRYEIVYVLEDDFGRTSDYFVLTIDNIDTTPPEIGGTEEIIIEVGEDLNIYDPYSMGLWAEDAGENITSQIYLVEDDRFDNEEPGIYTLEYKAKDDAGNISSTHYVEIWVVEEPYEVESCEDLQSIGQGSNIEGTSHDGESWPTDGHYVLVNDIDCEGEIDPVTGEVINGFEPIKLTTGAILDGNGYTISGIIVVGDGTESLVPDYGDGVELCPEDYDEVEIDPITGEEVKKATCVLEEDLVWDEIDYIYEGRTKNVGIFESITNAYIKDLTIEDAIVYGYENVGILVGQSKGSNKIEKVNISGEVYGNKNVGGVIGYSDGVDKITNGEFDIYAEGNYVVGAVIGRQNNINEISNNDINSHTRINSEQPTIIVGSTKGLTDNEEYLLEVDYREENKVDMVKEQKKYKTNSNESTNENEEEIETEEVN